MYPDIENCKAYVVFRGIRPGVYQTWDSADAQVSGIRSPRYKGYDTLANARAAWDQAKLKGTWAATSEPSSASQRRKEGNRALSYSTPSPSPSPLQAPPAHSQTWKSPVKAMQFAVKEECEYLPSPLIKKAATPYPTPLTPTRDTGVRPSFKPSPTPLSSPLRPKTTVYQHASSPTPRQRSDSRWFLPSDITPHQPRDEEKAWFVVAEGVRPGVYQGRSKAAMYLGPSGEGKLYKWPTQDQANACFVKLHDELRLVYL